MQSRVILPVALCALILPTLSACQNKAQAHDLKSDIQAILTVESAMRAAYLTRDAAKLAALYAPDASLYVPGEPNPRVGTDAILKGAQKDLADPAFRISFEGEKVGAFEPGIAGYSKGKFTIHYTDPRTKAPASYSGRYLTLFAKQESGQWKAIEDMATPTS